MTPRPASPVEAVDDLIEATLRGIAGKPLVQKTDVLSERSHARERSDAALDERVVKQLQSGVSALLEKKAEKLVVLNLQGLTTVSDYFVLATATSTRQAQALADAVEQAMKKEGRRATSIEGYQTAAWILLDYGDVVFHLFHDESRRFYGLERLWGDAPDATDSFVAARPRPAAPG